MSESKDIKEAKQTFIEVINQIESSLCDLYLAKQKLHNLEEKILNKETTSQINEIYQIVKWSDKYIDIAIKSSEDMKKHITSTADDLNRI